MALSPHLCVIYLSDGESRSYLLLHYPFSRKKWDHFLLAIHLFWVMPKTFFALLRQWYVPLRHPRGKIFWLSLFHGICWGIWKEWNRGIFNDTAKSLYEIIDAITYEVASWAVAYLDIKSPSISDITRDYYSNIFYRL